MKRPHEPHQFAVKQRSRSESGLAQPGVIVTSDELYALHNDALRIIKLSDSMISNVFPGAYKVLFQGRGLEFKEVRQYQSGDDFRLIDWRVTARTGQMHTKLFHPERERTLYLLVDGCESMHFGTRQQFKWVLAARIAAIFSWLAYENGDRVSAMVSGDAESIRYEPPGMGESALVKIFHLLSEKEPQKQYHLNNSDKQSNLLDALKNLQRVIKHDSMILILSDFRDLNSAIERQLASLMRRADIAAIMLYDILEKRLPGSGQFPVSNGKKFRLLDVGQKNLSYSYEKLFNERQEYLNQFFRKRGSVLYSIATDDNLIDRLRHITIGHRLGHRRVSGVANSART